MTTKFRCIKCRRINPYDNDIACPYEDCNSTKLAAIVLHIADALEKDHYEEKFEYDEKESLNRESDSNKEFKCMSCDKINKSLLMCDFCGSDALLEFSEKVKEYPREEVPFVLPENLCTCPGCGIAIEITAVNCGEFCCALLSDGSSVPHATPADLEAYKKNGQLVAGCGVRSRFDTVTKKLVKL